MAQSKTTKAAQPKTTAPKTAPRAAKPAPVKAAAAKPKAPDVKKVIEVLDALFPDWNKAVPGRKKLSKEEIVAMWYTPERVASASGPIDKVVYYLVTAEHHRNDGTSNNIPGAKIESKFEGKLPLVRVKVPEGKVGGRTEVIRTHWGDVIFEDRRLPTLGSVRDWVRRHIKPGQPEPDITRADLFTPPRTMGHRFAAVALYLLYKNNEKTPFGYIVEAGMAAGQPKTLYFSASTTTELTDISGYSPTPFAHENNSYTASVTLDGDELVKLVIKAFAASPMAPAPKKPSTKEADHYLTLTATYERLKAAEVKEISYHPWTLLGQAAMRVLEIAKAKGLSVEKMNHIAKVLLHDLNVLSSPEADTWKTKPTPHPLVAPHPVVEPLMPRTRK